MSPPNRRSRQSSEGGKENSSVESKKAALESYFALPGVPDDELESLELQEFFDEVGVLERQAPANWILSVSKRNPLSRSMPSKEQHGSLSTRQQLLNSQSSLEAARKRAESQRKAASEMQKSSNASSVDIQRLRHLHMVFQPLGYVPAAPVFKKHLAQMYMEDVHSGTAEDDLESEENLTTKGSGSAMSNEQRSLLHMIFKKSVGKVTGKGGRTALMYRWTWFRFLVQCKLIGPDSSWDRRTPSDTRVSWGLAVKIFKLFQEPNSEPPALSFGGWANALQATIRAKGMYQTGPEVIEALFETFAPRAMQQLGIGHEEEMAGRSGSRASSRSTSRSMSRSNSRSMSRSMSRSNSRSMSRSNSRSMSRSLARQQSRGAVSRSSSRALSFFSTGGSTTGEDSDEGEQDDGKLPAIWQMTLAEQQICEPECLQLLHEYLKLLEALFGRYARKEQEPVAMTRDDFEQLLKDLQFFPDFVQHYSLKKHLNGTEARYGEDVLRLPAFVETLCRICFCFLNIYGNSAQQSAPSKYKMLWVLALLESRLPEKIQAKLNSVGTGGAEAQSPDSLWHQRDADFDVSRCSNEEIVLFCTMDKLSTALPMLNLGGGQVSTMETEIDRALSMLRR